MAPHDHNPHESTSTAANPMAMASFDAILEELDEPIRLIPLSGIAKICSDWRCGE